MNSQILVDSLKQAEALIERLESELAQDNRIIGNFWRFLYRYELVDKFEKWADDAIKTGELET